jgi:hypothetical protein
MKKLLFTLTLLLLSIPFVAKGQEKDKKSYPWSFSFSYSPKINASKYKNNLNSGDYSYFTSFDHKFDHRITKNLAISFGVDFNKFLLDMNYQSSIGVVPEITTNYLKTILIEFPMQLNYHFRDTSKVFDPYLKIAYRNVFHYENIESIAGYYHYELIRYFSFIEVGIGSYLKLSNNFSIIYESSLGFGLNYKSPHYFYIEGLVGIRYTLK